ncbi:hypothetical protein FGO68_gene6217 [Halteria grandinella]|uniref:Uncharacterized protein n=1 Tax=Halteria grandinella TaxID=5974 RepID=A0A8J8T8E7_HALGN|nr:hypothetical protein FGO68_gene6217 [Halteria grandinella]
MNHQSQSSKSLDKLSQLPLAYSPIAVIVELLIALIEFPVIPRIILTGLDHALLDELFALFLGHAFIALVVHLLLGVHTENFFYQVDKLLFHFTQLAYTSICHVYNYIYIQIMCSITLEIDSCFVKEKGTFFLVAQLDETEYPDKQKTSQKFRTDLQGYNSQYLRFHKNKFKFEGISLGNRLVFKFGCFKVKSSGSDGDMGFGFDPNDANQLLKNSVLYASSSYVVTQNFLSILRTNRDIRDKVEKREDIMYDQAGAEEQGRITCSYSLLIEGLDDLIYEDNREIEKVYFDTFVKDKAIIASSLAKVEKLLKKKGLELDEKVRQVDERNDALRTLAVDLAFLRKQHEQLVSQNESLARSLSLRQRVDEIHIEIDVLSQSPQGIMELREIFTKMGMRYEVERRKAEALEMEYQKIEPQLLSIKRIKTQMEEIKKASNEVDFHQQRYKAVIQRIQGHKETIKNQEEIITNLAHQIKAQTESKAQVPSAQSDIRETQVLLSELKFKKEQLNQKLKQLPNMFNGPETKSQQINPPRSRTSVPSKNNSSPKSSQSRSSQTSWDRSAQSPTARTATTRAGRAFTRTKSGSGGRRRTSGSCSWRAGLRRRGLRGCSGSQLRGLWCTRRRQAMSSLRQRWPRRNWSRDRVIGCEVVQFNNISLYQSKPPYERIFSCLNRGRPVVIIVLRYLSAALTLNGHSLAPLKQHLLLLLLRHVGRGHDHVENLSEESLAVPLPPRKEPMVLYVLHPVSQVAISFREIVLCEGLYKALCIFVEGALFAGEVHLVLEYHLEQLQGILMVVGAVPHKQLVQKDTQSVPVHCLPVALAQEDLGGQVLRSAAEGVSPLAWLELLDKAKV